MKKDKYTLTQRDLERRTLLEALQMYGTEAKDSEIFELCESAGANEVDFNKVLRAYKTLAEEMKSWIAGKTDYY